MFKFPIRSKPFTSQQNCRNWHFTLKNQKILFLFLVKVIREAEFVNLLFALFTYFWFLLIPGNN